MIQCRECGQQELAGTMFCSVCGESLMELEGKQAVMDQSPTPAPPSLVGQSTDQADSWSEIIFMIPSGGRQIRVTPTKDIHVGRSDDGTPGPDINLQADGGSDLGVSRSHAMIKFDEQGEGLVILDLNSTNGTYLNQYRLPPELPYPLNNGDEIQFGNLLVHVFLK